jgi:hypothetical protein
MRCAMWSILLSVSSMVCVYEWLVDLKQDDGATLHFLRWPIYFAWIPPILDLSSVIFSFLEGDIDSIF